MLRQLYGLDQPYLRPVSQVDEPRRQGDFGESMEWQRPVSEVLGDRLWMTVFLSFAALVLTWGLALPIGIYSAVRQYSIGDYVFTFLGFIGLAVPNFLLALIILYLVFPLVRANVGGLFSAEYELAPWSWAKVLRPDVAPAAACADPGARRHRAADPHHAREPARRAAPALRGHGARQRFARNARDPEVSRARRAQSLRQRRSPTCSPISCRAASSSLSC